MFKCLIFKLDTFMIFTSTIKFKIKLLPIFIFGFFTFNTKCNLVNKGYLKQGGGAQAELGCVGTQSVQGVSYSLSIFFYGHVFYVIMVFVQNAITYRKNK